MPAYVCFVCVCNCVVFDMDFIVSLVSQNPISKSIFTFVSVDGDKMSVDEDTMSVELRSSGRAKWGELVAPLGDISWPKSYFNTRLVDIVYMMHTQR